MVTVLHGPTTRKGLSHSTSLCLTLYCWESIVRAEGVSRAHMMLYIPTEYSLPLLSVLPQPEMRHVVPAVTQLVGRAIVWIARLSVAALESLMSIMSLFSDEEL